MKPKPNPYDCSREPIAEEASEQITEEASGSGAVGAERLSVAGGLRRMTGMTAIVLAVFAIGPGAVSWAVNQRTSTDGAKRFATYDEEVMFFGVAVEPRTAQWLGVTIGPTLLFAGSVLMKPERGRMRSTA